MVAVMVTGELADLIVMSVPPVVGSAANETALGSEALHVAVPLPPVTMAGTWNGCAVLSVMNAEYIGAKWICRLVLAVQAPPSPDGLPESTVVVPESPPDAVVPLLELEQATTAVAPTAAAAEREVNTPLPTRLPMFSQRITDSLGRGGTTSPHEVRHRICRAPAPATSHQAQTSNETRVAYWQVPPPAPATSALAQKVSDPPASPPPKVQQLGAPVSVQSALVLQRRTVLVPMHVNPDRFVLHADGVAQAVSMGAVLQSGAVPPVMGMVPQQTSPEAQSVGSEQGAPPELESTAASGPPPEPPSARGPLSLPPSAASGDEELELQAARAQSARAPRTTGESLNADMAPW
jgi:hypothetical protein